MNNIDEDIKIARSVIHNKDFTWNSSETIDDDVIDNAIEHLLSELETYKKIAEKLAKYVEENSKGIICNFYEANLQKDDCVDMNCNECIIDWARKEVEKDV